MYLKDAKKLIAYWQTELNLRNWKIDIQWAPAHEMSHDDAIASIWWFTEDEIAHVKLVKAAVCSDDIFEETIVHEMLHLRLEGHRTIEKRYDPQYELALNRLAALLVKLRHQND